MSSSGRYQSWLLNTVRSGSRQLVDRLSTAARHVQVAVVWGAQVVMYPIYLLFQGTRLAGRQLTQAVQRTILQLQARSNPSLKDLPASDKAIQSTMEFVQSIIDEQPSLRELFTTGSLEPAKLSEHPALLPSSPTSSLSPFTPSPSTLNLSPSTLKPQPSTLNPLSSIQSIASLLESRSLVLVDSTNQLWDVLTPEQQQQLYRRVIWEVIDYDRTVQRVALLRQGFALPALSQRRLPLPPDRPQALPSVRRFRSLMAWMQQSPVAIAINLFQEADLVGVPIVPIMPDADNFTDSFSELDTVPASALIDPDAWCGETLPTPVRMPTESWLTMADLFGAPDFDAQDSRVQDSRAQDSRAPDDTHDLWDTAENGWQAHAHRGTTQPVEAWSGKPLAIASAPPNSLSLPDKPLPNKLLPDNQIFPDMQELLPEQDKVAHGIVQATPPIVTVSASQSRAMTALRVSPQAPAPSLASTSQAQPTTLQTSPRILEGAVPSSSIEQAEASSPEHTPDWIETHAETTGYVKHPLEQVLEWLDQLLTWIEAMGIAIWKMIRHQFNP